MKVKLFALIHKVKGPWYIGCDYTNNVDIVTMFESKEDAEMFLKYKKPFLAKSLKSKIVPATITLKIK